MNPSIIVKLLRWKWWKWYLLLLVASQIAQLREPPPRIEFTTKSVLVDRATGDGFLAGAPVRIAYADEGAGPPLILLHGSPGAGANFSRITPLLSPHFRVIAPDLPGFGASERWIPDYGIRAHAKYVLALMDALKIERAHVLGFSMGSGVALHLAELAPQRVASLIFYGGIGIQEGEGSGDYHFEHFKYAVGYALLVALPEIVPHFGLLGPRSARHAFIRNFWDTDQRPLQEILKGLRAPLLILHGERDPLVPVWVAREHHHLAPQSELVVFDDSHFMVFSEAKSARLASEIVPFVQHVESPQFFPQSRTVDPYAAADEAADRALEDVGGLRIRRGSNPWTQMAAIILATFASEDLACIAVGLLIHRQYVDASVGLMACFLGIFVGDLGLWLAGRLLGRRILQWRWVQRRLPVQHVERLGAWFDQQGWRVIFAARFLPGTRLPVYFGAGLLGKKVRKFLFAAMLAALIWTPVLVLLVALAGPRVVRQVERVFGEGWIALLVAGGVLFLLLRIGEMMLTEPGRARLAAFFARLWRWEFWPASVFYLPLAPWIAWLGWRHGGLTTPTAANPAIPHGGFVGESKFDILARLPAEWVAPTALLSPAPVVQRCERFRALLRERGWKLPVILKPDAAQRGAGLKLLRNEEYLEPYFASHPAAVLVQTYHPGPFEAGIFYYRMPAANERGRILSITDKHFPVLAGDGKRSIERLIWRHPRHRMQARTFLARMDGQATYVPAEGERVALAVAGNHCQGTLFRDGAHLITPALEARIDEIARTFEGFYFGRFDVRYADVDAFRNGRGFQIIELNGATSESTNIYDPSWSLLAAYRVLFRQWRLLYEIGAANRARGHAATPLRELIRITRAYYRNRRVNAIAD